MAKTFKYLALFILLVSPLVGLIYSGRNIYYALVGSEIQQAKIIRCEEVVTRKGNRIRRTWHPIARSRTRDLVKGTIGKRTQKICQKDLESEVRVSFSKISKGKNLILTFEEIWLYPLLTFIFSIVFYLLVLFAYLSQRKK